MSSIAGHVPNPTPPEWIVDAPPCFCGAQNIPDAEPCVACGSLLLWADVTDAAGTPWTRGWRWVSSAGLWTRAIIPVVACLTCIRLQAEFELLVRHQAATIEHLYRDIGTLPLAEYKRLRLAAHEARVDAEAARSALEQHQPVHAQEY
jgi:hypothetical protein